MSPPLSWFRLHSCLGALALLTHAGSLQAALPTDESGVIAYLTDKGLKITKNPEGHAITLFSRGASVPTPDKPEVKGEALLTAEEYQLIAKLTQLEMAAFNLAPLRESEWGFLKALPKLKRLSIWHGHKFAALEQFSGLPVESLTIGGCMGLRDLNRDNPKKQRDAIMALPDLPNLKRASWYHSPLMPDDSQLTHIVSHFPKLEDLNLDFTAPSGSQTTLTPNGLALLQKLPLTALNIEGLGTLTPDHFKALAGIKTLKKLTLTAGKLPVPADGLALFKQARPDVNILTTPVSATPVALPKKK